MTSQTLLEDFARFVNDAEAGTQFAKWAHDNPNDLAKWRSFRDAIMAGQRPNWPTMATPHGRELVDAGRLYLDATAPAPPPPPPSTGFRVGMQGNIAGNGAAAQTLTLDIGAKIIREDRGDYALSWAASHSVEVCAIVWLDPNSPGIGAKVIELDNEPYENGYNGVGFAAWAAKALSAAKQIKTAHPEKTVIVPVGPCWNGGYVNGVDCVMALHQAAPSIWQYVDGVAVHPYSQPADPNPGRFPVLDRWRANLKAIGHDLPFWVTEVGWPTGGNNWNTGGQTQQQQADYLAQFVDACKARGDVRVIFPYQLQDWGPRDTDSEHYFGLTNPDGSHKVAYATVKQRIAANP